MWDPDPALFQSWLYQVRTNKTRDGAGVMSFTGRPLGVARSGGKIVFGTEEHGV